MSQILSLPVRAVSRATELKEPYLLFSNPGTLEIELVKLLGVSVKENDDPIGFFGTGLKYAMATALRLGGSMTIITGGKTYEVYGQKITLRDKEFTQITLNGDPLGFTTELGKQWEPWMVVRELYSNAKDEQGETVVSREELTSIEHQDMTIIALRGQCFVDVWHDRGRHFLQVDQERPVVTSDYCDAYPTTAANNSVFYRTIRIHDTDCPTLYKYNLIGRVTLTEDRTLRYNFQMSEAIERTIITSTNSEFISRCLTSGDEFHEGWLTYSDSHHGVEMSDEFVAICSDLLDRMPENVNKHAINFFKCRTQTEVMMTPAAMTRVQQMQMDKAIGFVKQIGFPDLDRFPMQVVRWLGENVYGKATDGKIYISQDCFDKGTKFLASTIVEEYVHCRYGFNDESRNLQNWLFDRIITMGEEHVTGEPL